MIEYEGSRLIVCLLLIFMQFEHLFDNSFIFYFQAKGVQIDRLITVFLFSSQVKLIIDDGVEKILR